MCRSIIVDFDGTWATYFHAICVSKVASSIAILPHVSHHNMRATEHTTVLLWRKYREWIRFWLHCEDRQELSSSSNLQFKFICKHETKCVPNWNVVWNELNMLKSVNGAVSFWLHHIPEFLATLFYRHFGPHPDSYSNWTIDTVLSYSAWMQCLRRPVVSLLD